MVSCFFLYVVCCLPVPPTSVSVLVWGKQVPTAFPLHDTWILNTEQQSKHSYEQVLYWVNALTVSTNSNFFLS